MTRDEAIEIEERKIKSYTQNLTDTGMYRVAAANIDALIELGLLKVDEPVKRVINFRKNEVTIEEISNALFSLKTGYKLVKE